ncbi:MAG: hypothetical protein HY854_01765 [Burkholderiales bacterium]|nr:hypothetical protein [Burkholderiales bacterium]
MNREQWQQKRGHAGARRVPTAITEAEIAHRVGMTARAANSARPASGAAGQPQAEESGVAARRTKPKP